MPPKTRRAALKPPLLQKGTGACRILARISVKSVAGSRESSLTGHFFTQTKDLFAGLAGSVMSVAYGLSFEALIFSASLHTWLTPQSLSPDFHIGIITDCAASLASIEKDLRQT